VTVAKRVAIAVNVWLVAIPFAGAAAVAVFIELLLTTGFGSSGGRFGAIAAITTITVATFLATAAPTKLVSGYVARTSNGAFHAGPIVVGVAAGFLAGTVVQFVEGAGAVAAFALIAVIGPISGAVLGTLVNVPLRPIAVGVASAVLALMFVVVFGR